MRPLSLTRKEFWEPLLHTVLGVALFFSAAAFSHSEDPEMLARGVAKLPLLPLVVYLAAGGLTLVGELLLFVHTPRNAEPLGRIGLLPCVIYLGLIATGVQGPVAEYPASQGGYDAINDTLAGVMQFCTCGMVIYAAALTKRRLFPGTPPQSLAGVP